MDNPTGKSLSSVIAFEQSYMLKGIAMLMIIFIHSINEYECYYSTWSECLLVPDYGELGCSMFFFLSGYGMLNSSVNSQKADWNYLFRHILKLVIPFLAGFFLTAVVLYIKGGISAHDFVRILWLSMPDGVDLWFFKTVIINYTVMVMIFMTGYAVRKKLAILSLVYLVAIIAMYLLRCPGFWYVSILQFPFKKQPKFFGLLINLLLPVAEILAAQVYALPVVRIFQTVVWSMHHVFLHEYKGK